MFRSSIPLGRWMGVDVRLHLSFPVLFMAAAIYGLASTGSAARGIGVFAALVLAVGVRETARAIAAAYVGLRLRAIFLLPIGGVMAYAPQSTVSQDSLRPLNFAAPLANFTTGFIILGLGYAAAPGVHLITQPWVSASHLFRSFVWMQFIIGAVNFLPAAAMPTRQFLQSAAGGKATVQAASEGGAGGIAGSLFGILPAMAIATMLAGIFSANVPIVIVGLFILLFSVLKSQSAAAPATTEEMRVAEVMQTDFATLSSSDTLRGALSRTVHSLQEVFPVVRGNRLVGSVSRQTLADLLQAEGDGYLQGVMMRNLQLATPQEQLLTALGRAASHGASEFIPVIEDDRVLGILTPQNLGRAVQQVRLTRVPAEEREPRP